MCSVLLYDAIRLSIQNPSSFDAFGIFCIMYILLDVNLIMRSRIAAFI